VLPAYRKIIRSACHLHIKVVPDLNIPIE